MEINESSVREQSLRAYGQWCVQWREQAKHHSKYPMKSLKDFEHSGIGKACLLIANGYSFEMDKDIIVEHQDKVDIFVCDKSLGPAIELGLKPKYCMVCDANVNYEKYLKPYEDKLQDTILLINVCGNPSWSDNGNWKDKYYFVNQDILKSENEFMALSGCKNKIPAGTNVSNAMIIMLFQADNDHGKRNFFGYDKVLTVGFDYCWPATDGNYYAFDHDGGGKFNYMRHIYTRGRDGRLVYTSTNLLFSCEWVKKYVNGFQLPLIQCSKNTIMDVKFMGYLEQHIQYSGNTENGSKFKALIEKKKEIIEHGKQVDKDLRRIANDHFQSFVMSL